MNESVAVLLGIAILSLYTIFLLSLMENICEATHNVSDCEMSVTFKAVNANE